MKWAEFLIPTTPYKDEETSKPINSFQYAGPLRIPPENFQLRVRKENGTHDTVNSRYVESWNADVPQQQTPYYRSDIPGGGVVVQLEKRGGPKSDSHPPPMLDAVYYDMAPLSSRTDKRDFRQSKPYDTTGPNLAMNPFFDRYDPTRDPRNMLREVRSAVYETKEVDRGIKESERIRARTFNNRYMSEGETSIKLTEWTELLRPKIDNPEIVYRNQSELWKLGSKDGVSNDV
jgi:hypothetical protein